MKTSVELYTSKPGEITISPLYIGLRKYELPRIVDDMVLWGIGRVSSNYVNLGLKSWSDIGFKPLSVQPPAELLKARNFILRHMSERLLLYGILSVVISPTDKELQAIQTRWRTLEGNEEPGKQGIPLNIELDPVSKDALSPAVLSCILPQSAPAYELPAGDPLKFPDPEPKP
jgi:hypothetical protein